jgi:hypothetical protein
VRGDPGASSASRRGGGHSRHPSAMSVASVMAASETPQTAQVSWGRGRGRGRARAADEAMKHKRCLRSLAASVDLLGRGLCFCRSPANPPLRTAPKSPPSSKWPPSRPRTAGRT